MHASQAVGELPANLQKIVGTFQMVPDPMARYKQLLFFAAKLPALPDGDKVPENKVEGCVSQVWVVPEVKEDGKVYWRADSDSQLTKGLAALLVQGLSGCTPAEVLTVQPDFIEQLGLKQSLTPSRNNGFLNMFRLMQKKCLALLPKEGTEAEAAAAAAAPTPGSSNGSSPSGAASSNGNGAGGKPVRSSIIQKLTQELQPSSLEVIDDSSKHAGHAGSRMLASPSGETHFSVKVVSPAFEGMMSVKRHRKVYEILAEEIEGGVHALSLITRTPEEEAKA